MINTPKMLSWGIPLVLIFVTLTAAAAAESTDCRLLVLKKLHGEIVVDAVELGEGDERVLPGEDIVTFILPLGVGQAGDVVQKNRPKGDIVARCIEGELTVGVRFEDGRERSFPPVPVAGLDGYDVRVSVIGGDGSKKVFMIRRYVEVEIDPGPAIDMFGGMIPLEAGDYSVTTEVTEHAPPPPVEGRAPLAFNGDFLLVEGRLADGRTGIFIVDFGAGGTVVSKRFLPPGTEIARVTAVEYSPDGRREFDGSMGGAGGTVTGFLGNAVLDEITFGDAGFEGVTVRVIDEMPPFADTEIAGILGLDLLRRGGVVSFGYGADAVLTWGGEAATSAIDVPFRTAANHIFIDGIVDGVKADVLLDTGARESILSQGLADRAELQLSSDVAREFKGLDGRPIPARTATVGQFTLGPAALGERRFYAAPLAVFDAMGLAQSGVLLGNDFLKEFRSVQVDFARERVRLDHIETAGPSD